MTQRSGLTMMRRLLRPLAAACLLALAAALAAPVADAADPSDPIVPGIRPSFRPIPTPRITPRPPPATIVRPSPGAKVGPSPGMIRPTIPGPDCRARCGAQCQMISCAGLNASQCTSVRQQCRVTCASRC